MGVRTALLMMRTSTCDRDRGHTVQCPDTYSRYGTRSRVGKNYTVLGPCTKSYTLTAPVCFMFLST